MAVIQVVRCVCVVGIVGGGDADDGSGGGDLYNCFFINWEY